MAETPPIANPSANPPTTSEPVKPASPPIASPPAAPAATPPAASPSVASPPVAPTVSAPPPAMAAAPRTFEITQFKVAPKIGRNVITFYIGFTVIVLVILIGLLLAIAKSGLMKIPVLSKLYIGPVPSRLVKAEPMTADEFNVLLGSRFLSASVKSPTPPYAVTFTEQEVTGVIMTAIDLAMRDAKWKQIFTQIAIKPEDFEFLSKFERGFMNLDLMLRLKPELRDGQVRFEPVYFQIGDYKLPASLAYRVLSYFFARDLGTWELKFGDAKILDFRLFDGYAEIKAGVIPSATSTMY